MIAGGRTELTRELLRRLTGHNFSAATDLYDHPQLERLLPLIEPARKVVEELFG